MGEYAEVFDLSIDDPARAYSIRYGSHKMQHMMLRPEDYTVDKTPNGYVISTRTIKRYARFATLAQATDFIAKRIHVHTVFPRMYGRECHCGYVKEGWSYASSSGIVFEQCNKCQYPLYQIVRLHLDAQVLDSIDLNELLG